MADKRTSRGKQFALLVFLKKPIVVLAVLFMISIVLLLFIGVFGAVAGVVLIAAYLVFLLKFYKGNLLKELVREKQLIVEELKLAEKQFLKHKISKSLFEQIAREKQERLIGIESAIKRLKMEKQLEEFHSKKLEKLDSKRRHKMKELLNEKELLVDELKNAQQKYFKRKISDQTFKKISEEKQKELIGIETKIAGLYKEEAREIMQEAMERVEKVTETGKKEEQARAAEQITEQIVRKRTREKRQKKKRE